MSLVAAVAAALLASCVVTGVMTVIS